VTNKLGYVYLPSFYGTPDRRPYDEDFRSCTADVAKYLADFNAQDVEGLVLDLRGNGGGHLVEAIALSSRFVHSGPVVQVRAKSLVDVLPIPVNNAVSFRKPMVVLVDRISASASEIVAAHLQDTGRAVILGDSHTHGKGTVQTVKDLGPKTYGSIKVTTARFYRIDGRSTQIKGVDADVRLPSVLESLDIGEDKLDGALPFTKILKTRYAKCWNMDTYAEELGTLSAARLADDARYAKHLECVAGTKTVFDRETVPLDHGEFMEMARSDRLLREDRKGAAKDGKKRVRRRRGTPDDDDVVLDEAFEVLSDLVRLNDGAELPRPAPNAYDWYNAIFGY
jgi:carboxyl-terminal processing protease